MNSPAVSNTFEEFTHSSTSSLCEHLVPALLHMFYIVWWCLPRCTAWACLHAFMVSIITGGEGGGCQRQLDYIRELMLKQIKNNNNNNFMAHNSFSFQWLTTWKQQKKKKKELNYLDCWLLPNVDYNISVIVLTGVFVWECISAVWVCICLCVHVCMCLFI